MDLDNISELHILGRIFPSENIYSENSNLNFIWSLHLVCLDNKQTSDFLCQILITAVSRTFRVTTCKQGRL